MYFDIYIIIQKFGASKIFNLYFELGKDKLHWSEMDA